MLISFSMSINIHRTTRLPSPILSQRNADARNSSTGPSHTPVLAVGKVTPCASGWGTSGHAHSAVPLKFSLDFGQILCMKSEDFAGILPEFCRNLPKIPKFKIRRLQPTSYSRHRTTCPMLPYWLAAPPGLRPLSAIQRTIVGHCADDALLHVENLAENRVKLAEFSLLSILLTAFVSKSALAFEFSKSKKAAELTRRALKPQAASPGFPRILEG